MKSVSSGYELSWQQQNAWENAEYRAFVSGWWEIQVPLDPDKFRAAVERTVDEHELIRSEIFTVHTTPLISISDEAHHLFKILDTTNSIEAVSDYLKTPLSEGCLLEITLHPLEECAHLIIKSSPLVLDTLSLKKIVEDISGHYYGTARDEEEPFQYFQYTEWQKSLPEEEDAVPSFWDELVGASPPILSLENKKGAKRSAMAIRGSIDFDQIKGFAEKNNLAADLVLQGAWQALIWAYAGFPKELLTYVTHSGRSIEIFDKIIGPFAKSIPFPVAISEATTFEQLLDEISRKHGALSEYLDYYRADKDKKPPEKVGFEYLSLLDEKLKKTWQWKDFLDADQSKLKLSCYAFGKRLDYKISYLSDLVSAKAIQHFRAQWEQLIERLMMNAEVPIIDLLEITEDELEDLSPFINNEITSPFVSVIDLFEKQVASIPNQLAVKDDLTSMTWTELNATANQVAGLLRATYHVKKGDIVAIQVTNSVGLIACILGILKAGGTYLPLDSEVPEGRLQYILDDCKPVLLIGEDKILKKYPVSFIMMDDLQEQCSSFSPTNLLLKRSDDDLIYVIYTSGSTGKPKGVAIPDEALFNYVNWFKRRHEVNQTDATLLLSSVAFDLSYTSLWTALSWGCALYIYRGGPLFQTEKVIKILTDEPITYMKVTPSHFNLLVGDPRFEHMAYSKLQKIFLGGEEVRSEDIRSAWLINGNIRFINHYGPTETTIGTLTKAIDKLSLSSYKAKPALGFPVDNSQVLIVNRHGKIMPTGVKGEIAVGGKNLFAGYINLSREEKMMTNPLDINAVMYKTGDVGSWYPEDGIRFHGRADAQVKINGYRIELAEVENSVNALPEVDGAVVLISHPQNQLLAFVKAKNGTDSAYIYDALSQQLPARMIPAEITFVDQFPLLQNGKVDRKRLIQLRKMDNEYLTPPKNDLQQEIHDIWKVILQSGSISVDRSFFDAGGNSFKLIKVFRKLSNQYTDLTVTDLFKYNTIASLADFLEPAKETSKEENLQSFEV